MKCLWEHHLKYYDFFQNKIDGYNAVMQIHLRELKDYNNILDTGAGSGNLTLKFLRQGKKVMAIDSNKNSLAVLKDKCSDYKDNLKIKEMDVQKLYFEDSFFNAANSMLVIPFVKNYNKYFSEVYRVLKPNSRFIISGWAPEPFPELRKEITKELMKKGILPEHQKEWDHMEESSKINAQTILKGPKIGEIIKSLKNIGFVNIRVLEEKPYKKFLYLIVCEK